jgi:hypothetical protein
MQIPKYKISFFENCYSKIADEKELSFDEILEYFRTAAHKKFVAKDQLEAMICGALVKGERTAESLICRSIITYDIDYFKGDYDLLINYINICLKNNTYIVYTTVSSVFNNPKIRLLLFVNQNITPSQYSSVSFNLAKTLFKELFSDEFYRKENKSIDSAIDKSSYSAMQLMYLPNARDGFKSYKNVGDVIDITIYLNLDVKSETTELQEFIKTARNMPLNISNERVKAVLHEYNVEDTDRDSWLKVCQGLHHQYNGLEKGYKLFLDWSLKDSRFSEDEIRSETKTAYYSLKLNKSNPITFASTIAFVNDKKKLPAKIEVKNKDLPVHIDYSHFVHTKENKKGEVTGIKSTYENFEIMCKHYKIEVAYDKIGKDKINSLDQDNNSFLTTIKSLIILNNMDKSVACDYVNKLAATNSKNVFKAAIDNVMWDGISRLEAFYNTIDVDKDFVKTRNLYLLKWCQQMLYQSLSEGNKKIARNILVLKGKQSIGKSTWVKSLLPPSLQKYIGQGMTLNTNDTMSKYAVLKNLIVELAELEQSFKKTDINQFKSFFGVTEDILNMKYVAEPITFERTTSFIGTINDDNFLKDRSGSTRFLVLPVNKLNGFHKVDMLQVYKEILETTDYCNFELSEEEQLTQQMINEEFEQPNLLEEIFLDNFVLKFEEGGEYMNCSQMLQQLNLCVRDFTYSRKADIRHIIEKHGFKYRKDLKKWLVKIKNHN